MMVHYKMIRNHLHENNTKFKYEQMCIRLIWIERNLTQVTRMEFNENSAKQWAILVKKKKIIVSSEKNLYFSLKRKKKSFLSELPNEAVCLSLSFSFSFTWNFKCMLKSNTDDHLSFVLIPFFSSAGRALSNWTNTNIWSIRIICYDF